MKWLLNQEIGHEDGYKLAKLPSSGGWNRPQLLVNAINMHRVSAWIGWMLIYYLDFPSVELEWALPN